LERVSRGRVLAAFGAVYVIWGSTYLAILYAIETLPPFLMAGVRFLTAGALLYAWSAPRSERKPTAAEWRAAAIIGALLLLGGNGAVVWSEQTVPSGIAALLVAVTPCWIVLLAWLWHRGERPGWLTWLGLALGVLGIVLLVGPDSLRGNGAIPLAGVAVLMLGSLSWAVGSIYSKNAPTAPGALLSTGMQMLCGGSLLIAAGVLTGEVGRLDVSAISLRSVLALLYLLIFGALVGYSAYVWLLRVARPARVATYAYVNPLVAVILGWALAGEELTVRMGIAAIVIVVGVAMITIDSG
jgi:drug/metabolite transporter (DMT)-like permease